MHCALIKPEQASATQLKNITIISEYQKSAVSQVLPIAVKNHLKIPSYVYHETELGSTVYLTRPEELISIGIIHVVGGASRVAVVLAPSVMLVTILLWLGN